MAIVEKVLHRAAGPFSSWIKDTTHILNIIDNFICPESVLVGFDITNMFHYVDNKMRVNSVIRFSDQGVCKEPPTQQVIGALDCA